MTAPSYVPATIARIEASIAFGYQRLDRLIPSWQGEHWPLARKERRREVYRVTQGIRFDRVNLATWREIEASGKELG